MKIRLLIPIAFMFVISTSFFTKPTPYASKAAEPFCSSWLMDAINVSTDATITSVQLLVCAGSPTNYLDDILPFSQADLSGGPSCAGLVIKVRTEGAFNTISVRRHGTGTIMQEFDYDPMGTGTYLFETSCWFDVDILIQ